MIKNQTSLFNINQYQLDKDFPGLLSVGQEKSIKLFFHGRRLQSVRGTAGETGRCPCRKSYGNDDGRPRCTTR